MSAPAVTVSIPLDALAGMTVIAPAPELVSQRTSEAVIGIPARAYLDLLREPGCPLEVCVVGKLRLVSRIDLLSWLRRRGAPTTKPSPAPPANDTPTSREKLRERWRGARK